MEDLSSLFTSNVAPSSFAAQLVRAEVDNLTSQIAYLQEQLQKCYSVLSPVRRMPVEILGEIFSFVLPKILDADGRRQMVVLILVCKTWHEAAVLTRRLWSGLQIRRTEGKVPSFQNVVSWFSRSGNCPKVLEVGHDYDGCNCDDTDFDNDDGVASTGCVLLKYPLAQLLTEGPPLDRLSITSATRLCLINVLDSPQFHKAQSQIRPWDSVQSLELYFSSSSHEPPNPSDSIFLRLPSTVTSLRLERVEFPSNDDFEEADEESEKRTTPLPRTFLQRLTSFHLMCVWGGNRILTILKDCVNVETLTIDFDNDTIGPQNRFFSRLKRDGILLPKLGTLKLKAVRVPDVQILEFLISPALVNLEITFGKIFKDEAGRPKRVDLSKSLNPFLARAENATLRSLQIRNASMRASDLAQSLSFSLTHLTLENVDFDVKHPFQPALSLYPAPYLSQLEVLELLRVPYNCRWLSLMVDFLARDVGGPPMPQLKTWTMTHRNQDYISSDYIAKIESLERSGISISILRCKVDQVNSNQ